MIMAHHLLLLVLVMMQQASVAMRRGEILPSVTRIIVHQTPAGTQAWHRMRSIANMTTATQIAATVVRRSRSHHPILMSHRRQVIRVERIRIRANGRLRMRGRIHFRHLMRHHLRASRATTHIAVAVVDIRIAIRRCRCGGVWRRALQIARVALGEVRIAHLTAAARMEANVGIRAPIENVVVVSIVVAVVVVVVVSSVIVRIVVVEQGIMIVAPGTETIRSIGRNEIIANIAVHAKFGRIRKGIVHRGADQARSAKRTTNQMAQRSVVNFGSIAIIRLRYWVVAHVEISRRIRKSRVLIIAMQLWL
jgi:hypothetical protein